MSLSDAEKEFVQIENGEEISLRILLQWGLEKGLRGGQIFFFYQKKQQRKKRKFWDEVSAFLTF